MRIFITLLLLAACGAQPAPEFFGAARQEIVEGQNRFVIFQRAARFEVIRLGPYVARGPPQAALRARMLHLVERHTACRIREHSVIGDAGELRGSLSCPKG